MTGRVAKVLAMLNALSDEEKRELLALMKQPPEPDIGVRQPTPPSPSQPPAAVALAEPRDSGKPQTWP